MTFDQTFTNVPYVFLGIADIIVTGAVGFGVSVQSTNKTTFTVIGNNYDCIGPLLNAVTKLRIHYFAFDYLIIPNMMTSIYYATYNSKTNLFYSQSSIFAPKISSQVDLNDSSVHIICTIQYTCLRLDTRLPYIISSICD